MGVSSLGVSFTMDMVSGEDQDGRLCRASLGIPAPGPAQCPAARPALLLAPPELSCSTWQCLPEVILQNSDESSHQSLSRLVAGACARSPEKPVHAQD